MRASDDERLPLCFFVYLMPIYSARAISEGGIKMKSKNIKRLENYPDILSLEDVRSILDVRTKKTAARWLNRPLSSRQVKKERLRHEGLVPVSKGSQAL